MATRASIARQDKDGNIYAIYSHWDGYPEGLGTTLEACYKSDELVLRLIEMGDVSSLGDTLESEDSIFYHRDRGEELRVHEFGDVESWTEWARGSWAEYAYLWRDDLQEWETFEQDGATRLKSIWAVAK